MPNQYPIPVIALAVICAVGTSLGAVDAAVAEPSVSAERSRPIVDTVGFRIGGYGFREINTGMETSATGWQACRMNGVGVFATRDIDRHFFLEGALDAYFTDEFVVGESLGNYDTPIDRVSGLMTVASGARLFPDAWLSPYVQVGLGLEITRVRLPALGMEDSAILPMGFFGIGGDLRVSRRLRLGATLRVNVMAYYDDAHFQTVLSPKAELATQGQFFFKYVL